MLYRLTDNFDNCAFLVLKGSTFLLYVSIVRYFDSRSCRFRFLYSTALILLICISVDRLVLVFRPKQVFFFDKAQKEFHSLIEISGIIMIIIDCILKIS